MSSFFCQTNCCADRIRKVPSPIRFAIPQAAHSRAVRCPLPGKCPPQAGGRLPGVSRKPPCPLTRTPRTMKALGPLRAAHSCDPTCIRNPACRPSCSYRLASPKQRRSGLQAARSASALRPGFHSKKGTARGEAVLIFAAGGPPISIPYLHSDRPGIFLQPGGFLLRQMGSDLLIHLFVVGV